MSHWKYTAIPARITISCELLSYGNPERVTILRVCRGHVWFQRAGIHRETGPLLMYSQLGYDVYVYTKIDR